MRNAWSACGHRSQQPLRAHAVQREDLLAGLGPLASFVRLHLSLTCCSASQLGAGDAAWAFLLCKANMQARQPALSFDGF